MPIKKLTEKLRAIGRQINKNDITTIYEHKTFVEVGRKNHKIISASGHFKDIMQQDPVGLHILEACPHLPMLDKIETALERMILGNINIMPVPVSLNGYYWHFTLILKKESAIIIINKCIKEENQMKKLLLLLFSLLFYADTVHAGSNMFSSNNEQAAIVVQWYMGIATQAYILTCSCAITGDDCQDDAFELYNESMQKAQYFMNEVYFTIDMPQQFMDIKPSFDQPDILMKAIR